MMTKYSSLIVFLVAFVFSTNAQSTDQITIPITQEDKRLEATIVCLDAVEAPTKYNAFAKPFISNPSFPEVGDNDTREELRIQINNWLIENPIIVDKIVKARKKAHDKLYGHRPY
jgi:hypothetical protein